MMILAPEIRWKDEIVGAILSEKNEDNNEVGSPHVIRSDDEINFANDMFRPIVHHILS